MLRGLYTAGIGMKTQMNKMDVLANNLANVDTTGFKRDSVATQSFSEEMLKRIHGPSGINGLHERSIGPFTSGVTVDEVYTDFSNGRLRDVGDPYCAAIQGSGFFTINVTMQNGEVVERFTRDGDFTLDANRRLFTKDGGQVMGQNGQIVLPEGDVTFASNGDVIVNGQIADTLRMVDIQNKETLRKVGTNYYNLTAQTVQTPFQGTIVQGFVEDSNINSVSEMVEIINTSRVYEANQRFVTAMDSTLAKAVNEVGRK